jgi:lipoprotein-releasing system permease protein
MSRRTDLGEAPGRGGGRAGVLAGPLAWTLARRLLVDPRSHLLGSSARAALVATTLGVAALGVALALMTGYREDLVARLVGGNAAVLIYATGEAGAPTPEAALEGLDGVERIERVRYLEGVLSAPGGEREVTLRAAPGSVGAFAGAGERLGITASGAWRVRLGARLAADLGAKPGDRLRLAVLGFDEGRSRFAFRTLEEAGTFETGFSEFDRAWAVVSPEAVASIPGGGAPVWEVALARPETAPEVAGGIRERLGANAVVVDWQQLNRQLFAALDLQKRALFLLLGLIVVVATFNVASTLVVLVRERVRDLGVLAALGLEPAALTRVFLFYGAALGAAGTALGLGIAAVISRLVTRFELLSFGPEIADIYFLSTVPLRLRGGDAAAIAAFALAVTLVACLVPAARAARLDPATALRYE